MKFTFWRDPGYALFLLALVYAPFAYGCTRPEAITGFDWILAAAFAAWVLTLLVRRRLPRIEGLAWIPVVAIGLEIVGGWWMAENGAAVYDFDYAVFVPASPWVEWLPGSVAANASLEAMGPLTALLAGFCIASDMAADAAWRRRLFYTMALTGVALALFGIVLKFGGTPLMSLFWEQDKIYDTNFALYRYHGNAGAYLNLVWPLVLALAWAEWEQFDERRVKSHFAIVAWCVALAICWGAVLMNLSKFALIVCCFLLPIFLILRVRNLMERRIGPLTWRKGLLLGLVPAAAAVVVWCLASASSFGTSSAHLYRLEQGISTKGTVDDRVLAMDAESTMLNDAGWHGFGPGTFRVEFPYYTNFLGDRIRGYWYYAHEDYLQAWIEWGWFGCVLWSVAILGALVRAWARFRDRANFSSSRDRLLWLGGSLSLTGVLLHALVDFPLQVLSIDLYVLTLAAIFWSRPL